MIPVDLYKLTPEVKLQWSHGLPPPNPPVTTAGADDDPVERLAKEIAEDLTVEVTQANNPGG